MLDLSIDGIDLVSKIHARTCFLVVKEIQRYCNVTRIRIDTTKRIADVTKYLEMRNIVKTRCDVLCNSFVGEVIHLRIGHT